MKERIATVDPRLSRPASKLDLLLERKSGLEQMVRDHFQACRADDKRDRNVSHLSSVLRKVKAEIAAL